jgi:tetratricopeptide (TPR) repeat protein
LNLQQNLATPTMDTRARTPPNSLPAAADAAAAPAALPERRSRSRQRWLPCLLVAAVLGVAVKPAYETWHARRTRFYKTACKEAVATQAWTRLDVVASDWLSWDAGCNDARMYRAEAAQQLGRVDDAVDELGRVTDDYHGALDALAIRADILFSDLNRPYEAVETWQRMLRINPAADLPRQRLIYFYAITMQRERMLKHIQRALELGNEPPEAFSYLLLAYEVTFSDGLLLTTEWLKSSPDDVPLKVARAIYSARFSRDEKVNVYAMSLAAAGDETLVLQCLEEYPDNLEVLAYYADKAAIAGEPERILELLGRCPADAERDPRFWRFRGTYLSSKDRFEEAAAAFRTALEIHPYDWRSRTLLSGVLRRLNQPEEAAEQSNIANLGKELHRDLYQIPNARALNPSIRRQMDDYFGKVAPPLVREAWDRLGD